MLPPRTETILNSIVRQYITKAVPVPSQSIPGDCGLEVSSATIRNEMAYLEHEGFIIRSHPSAGSVPSDKGYRSYVESLDDINLPSDERRLINHLFHQVEKEMDEWLNLAATLIARMVQNVAVVTLPKPKACHFIHLELVGLQDTTALAVIVLSGGRVRQVLIIFDKAVSQPALTVLASKLSVAYSGLTVSQISTKNVKLSAIEQQVTDSLVKAMVAEDDQGHEEQYLDGLHFMLNQPEFAHSRRLLSLMELVEQHSLLKNIIPPQLIGGGVKVIIGKENRAEAIQDFSVVVSHYGLPREAVGTICVIGPTRMPYAQAIATVGYLSLVLSGLAARLYGKEIPVE